MDSKLDCLKETKEGVLLFIQAVPRASKTEIVDIKQDRCRIRVKAPPVDGAANKALIAALAKIFKLSKKSVIIDKGLKGKQKTFHLHGITLENATRILEDNFKERAK